MKLALVGYGKMGELIKELALEKGHGIVAIIDPKAEEATAKEINKNNLNGAEACIDFSHPTVAVDNIKAIAAAGSNVVMGTTGWYEHMEEVKEIVEKNKIGLIWSGNFSLGVKMFMKMVEDAAKIVNKIGEYEVCGMEIHHKQKVDSPSGTAEMLGKILIDSIDRKKKVVYDRFDREPEKDEIHIASIRAGDVPGIHSIAFESESDTIELKHTARNRRGFANGAIVAAEFIKDKKGVFGIDDLMEGLL